MNHVSDVEWTQEKKDALFMRIATQIGHVLQKKNHDYGDSFHDLYQKVGNVSTFIRLTDKIQRFESLLSKPAQVTDESIEDTLRDIAGYAILTLASMHRIRTTGGEEQ